jgi:hypothetical protein
MQCFQTNTPFPGQRSQVIDPILVTESTVEVVELALGNQYLFHKAILTSIVNAVRWYWVHKVQQGRNRARLIQLEATHAG